ncbi:hypothetical protein SCFA_740014 [anaerobic digester metagenome]|uniref:Uncharacterized protein n=1 Tax=anaerobic digester metagenome TaxID=1263854 RepID=A0A485M440_9ZZZZ
MKQAVLDMLGYRPKQSRRRVKMMFL